jgi:PTS system glucitol/sorbitol-specific IIC component
MLHVPAVDGFKEKVEPDTMIIAIVDCGGTLRCGVYPKLGVKTIDTHPISPSGPLSRYINEGNFVSGVVEDNITLVERAETDTAAEEAPKAAPETKAAAETPAASSKGMVGFITNSGRAIGSVVNIFYQAGRDSVEIVLKSILPFMVFVSIMVGIINYTGVGNVLANAIKPLAGSLPGLLGLSVFCAIPFLSPVLGPGAVIAQVIGVLLGVQIGKGTIPPSYALPALFAINSQVGCDFLPVALTLAEAEPETVETGVPAMLFSRLITGPIAVLVAFLLSFGLY